MSVTIKDIAKATGLSTTAISLVLNNKKHRISEKNCQLIRETAKKMNYTPNHLAVSLLKQVTKNIGVIIPDISNVFFSEIVKGIESALYEKGYNLLLSNTNDKHQLEITAIQMMIQNKVDGLILIMSSETRVDCEKFTLNALKKMKKPVILMDCFNDNGGFSTISVDNFKASYMAVEYLLSLGHRQIGCICGPLGLKTNDDRLDGYIAALVAHDCVYNNNLIYEGDFRYKSGYEAISSLIKHKPTAILCLNDMMAYGAMNALYDKGISVPDDISVMGFDDIFFSNILSVPLTSIHQPAKEMGEMAGKLITQELMEKKKPQDIVFEPTIKIRQSTKSLVEENV